MEVSIIIPTYEEEHCIGDLIAHLFEKGKPVSFEILVIDGGSTDDTVKRAEEAGARVYTSPEKGRACQMNYGAHQATAPLLYFLHADAFPPPYFLQAIQSAVERGFEFGHFRQRIRSENKWVRMNSYLSRLSGLVASGGDQSLFITRSLFFRLEGFKDIPLMEDYELVQRARAVAKWVKIPAYLQVLDRKYLYNSFLRVNLANAIVFTGYRLGVSPHWLKRWYSRWIRGPRYKK